jgi:outer membrane protein OmpA-like peptidoglycan-associated protein
MPSASGHPPAPPQTPSGPAAPSKAWYQKPAAIIAVLATTVLLVGLFALASHRVSGFPEAPQKTLTMFTPAGGDKSPLVSYVHPPLARMVAEDRDQPADKQNFQLLAFQFINRGATALRVDALKTPDDCFELESEDGGKPSVPDIEPQQSTVALFRLIARSQSPSRKISCLGDRPLVIGYTWRVSDASLRTQLGSIFPTSQTPSGLTLTIPDVRFQTSKSTLRAATRNDLIKVAHILQSRATLHIRIEGYADSTGAEAHNIKLSEDRASTIKDFLISQGISPGILSVRGFGSANPVASNSTSQGRARNRRVYMMLTEDIRNQQSVSSSPLLVTTRSRLNWERFYRLIAIVLLPALVPLSIWFAGYIVQRTQEKRAELQSASERKLEVWKTILPGIISAIRRHYIPILSLLGNMQEETDAKKSNPDGLRILACALLFRRKIMFLTEKNGGLYFESLKGEKLCAQLINISREKCYELSKNRDAFQRAAEFYAPSTTIERMRDQVEMTLNSNPADEISEMFNEFNKGCLEAKARKELDALIRLILAVLEFESNAPLYLNWYGAPQTFNPKLEDLIKDLGLPEKSTNTEEENTEEKVRKNFEDYLDDLEKRYPESNPRTARSAQQPVQAP